MAFPNPITIQTHTIGDKTWVWDGNKWNLSTVVNKFNESDPIVPTVAGDGVTHELVYDGLDELTI